MIILFSSKIVGTCLMVLVYFKSHIIAQRIKSVLDAAIYQKLLIKAQATESLLRGDDEMRVSDDAANEVEMSYEEQLAAFSGDERTMQRVGLGQTLRTLEMARSSFLGQQAKAREHPQPNY